MVPAGICDRIVATRYPVTTNSVTVAAGAENSMLSAGNATATIVEFSGVRAAPSAAAVRTDPRLSAVALAEASAKADFTIADGAW